MYPEQRFLARIAQLEEDIRALEARCLRLEGRVKAMLGPPRKWPL